MKKIFLFFSICLITSSLIAQQKPAYQLFNAKGKRISYNKMLKTLKQKDIVLFGELHNNAIAHWLQLEVMKDCGELRQLVLGAEIFEQDNQQALDDYLQGKISAGGLDSNARLWKNYLTDYAPLVNYAKEHKLAFAASNVPRRYASLVARSGLQSLDSLSDQEKSWMAPLPIQYDGQLPGYKNMLAMMPGHSGENLPKAQALKDATMAFFILKYYKPGSLLIHFNGSYHSENHEGIYWYLNQQHPGIHIATITTVTQNALRKLAKENKGKADFTICVDEDMTNTY